jgi:hypothetical protein
MENVTAGTYDEWKNHPVTRKFMKMLYDDREAMKEGLAVNGFDEPEEVRGRCATIAIILNIEYESLFPPEIKERDYDEE